MHVKKKRKNFRSVYPHRGSIWAPWTQITFHTKSNSYTSHKQLLSEEGFAMYVCLFATMFIFAFLLGKRLFLLFSVSVFSLCQFFLSIAVGSIFSLCLDFKLQAWDSGWYVLSYICICKVYTKRAKRKKNSLACYIFCVSEFSSTLCVYVFGRERVAAMFTKKEHLSAFGTFSSDCYFCWSRWDSVVRCR